MELTKIHGYVCLVQGEESVDNPGSKLYKPTSKLLEKKAVAATSLKPKEEEKPERPVCVAGFLTHLFPTVFITLFEKGWALRLDFGSDLELDLRMALKCGKSDVGFPLLCNILNVAE